MRSSPLGANTVCKSRNSFADALFTQGLMALMQPIICCVRAQSAREFVTDFSGSFEWVAFQICSEQPGAALSAPASAVRDGLASVRDLPWQQQHWR